jgi:ATP citrate (pro-S)-lyase
MAQKSLREYDGKGLLARVLPDYVDGGAAAAVAAGITLPKELLQVSLPAQGGVVDFDALAAAAPWVRTTPLVVKPDQLIKRRGKGGLLLLNADWPRAVEWMKVFATSACAFGPRLALERLLFESG